VAERSPLLTFRDRLVAVRDVLRAGDRLRAGDAYAPATAYAPVTAYQPVTTYPPVVTQCRSAAVVAAVPWTAVVVRPKVYVQASLVRKLLPGHHALIFLSRRRQDAARPQTDSAHRVAARAILVLVSLTQQALDDTVRVKGVPTQPRAAPAGRGFLSGPDKM